MQLLEIVKDSKTLSNRDDVQEKLKRVLDDINRMYSSDIAAKFLITLGDEFQGLLLNSNNIIQIVKYIQRELHPVKMRIGIGIGEILTKINKEAAIGADGKYIVYVNAVNTVEEAISKLEKNGVI